MLGTILQRTIMLELLRVFGITLVSLTGLFLLGGIVAEASNRGLAPAQILTLMPLMVPSSLPYTIPATVLFATCNVYGRMAKDNEITALRAAGLNLWGVMKPAVVLGLIGTAATAGLYYDTIPRSFQKMRDQLTGEINEVLITVLKRQGSFNDPRLPYVVFARDVHGDKLIDVIFKHRPPGQGYYDTVARAREARIKVEPRIDPETGREASYVLMDMTQCTVINFDKRADKPDVAQFQSKEFAEKLPSDLFGNKGTPRSSDVTWPELKWRTEQLRQEEIERARLIDSQARQFAALPDGAPEKLAVKESLDSIRAGQRYRLRVFRSYEVEQHLRPALAIGCLCFALLGGPIGIWANRADFLSSFVIGFLPAVLVYYPLLICMTNLAKDGSMSIPVAVWAPNALFGAVAIGLTWRLVRK
jgi:lipopolysaccharide export system permease protein